MPGENLPTRVRAAPVRPTWSSTSAMRWRGMPLLHATQARWLRAVREWWAPEPSSIDPTVRSGSVRSR